jgi:hypothetical protein
MIQNFMRPPFALAPESGGLSDTLSDLKALCARHHGLLDHLARPEAAGWWRVKPSAWSVVCFMSSVHDIGGSVGWSAHIAQCPAIPGNRRRASRSLGPSLGNPGALRAGRLPALLCEKAMHRGIKVIAHNLAGRIDAECSGEHRVRDIDAGEVPVVQQIAMDWCLAT